MKVLVIENHVDTATALRLLLALDGFDVTLAHDGLTGVECARQLVPELVLCDLGLPDVDGYEVVRTLRADASFDGVVFVAVTGHVTSDARSEALRAGFDTLLAKPFDPDDLVELARTLAATRSQLPQVVS